MLKESALSIVVLCIVLFSTPIESYMSYALNRIFDTAIGVIAALLVNYFLPRPRVVSLWEGFKGLFTDKLALRDFYLQLFLPGKGEPFPHTALRDRKSTRLNSSHR